MNTCSRGRRPTRLSFREIETLIGHTFYLTNRADISKLAGTMTAKIVTALVAFAVLTSTGSAEQLPPSGGIVQFDSIATDIPIVHLVGYMARPRVQGRLPAVVVLHGCGGISGASIDTTVKVATWGYVALAPDSLTPRGLGGACTSGLPDQAKDAYAAMNFLKRQSFVDPNRIAVVGFSMGGTSALTAVELGGVEEQFTDKFRGAVAYYPICVGGGGVVTVRTMILVGEKDDWTPAQLCRNFIKVRDGKGAELQLAVYPGAYHAFDVPTLQPGITYLGHRLEYNEAAARQSEAMTRKFLEHIFTSD